MGEEEGVCAKYSIWLAVWYRPSDTAGWKVQPAEPYIPHPAVSDGEVKKEVIALETHQIPHSYPALSDRGSRPLQAKMAEQGSYFP